MTLQMKLKNMMMIGKDRTVFRYFEQSKLQSKYIRQKKTVKTVVSSSNFKKGRAASMACY